MDGKSLTSSKLAIIKSLLILRHLILSIKSPVDFDETCESGNKFCKTGTKTFSKKYVGLEYFIIIGLKLKSCL